MFRNRQNRRGATMGLVVGCCFILSLLSLGLFQITMLFGGSQELRNAVDSGTLNVGKEAVTLKTNIQGGDEDQFVDCEDTKGKIGLTNINRVLAKSFLINANAHAMSAKAFATGDSAQHANAVAQSAQTICDRITARLNDTSDTHPFFDTFIKSNSVNMLVKAEVKSSNNHWDTACVDRGEESNLRISDGQLPDGYDLPADSTLSITEKGQNSSTKFLKGYQGIAVNNKMLSFVPFKYDEKPHLINGFYFNASKVPVPNWNAPVPNALSSSGITSKTKYDNTATAYVVANPQRQYQAAIPYSFIRIKLEENEAHWRYQGIIPDKDTTYGYYPAQEQFHIRDAGSGQMTITATLGQQYLTTTLLQAIHAFGTPEHDNVNDVLLQRIREIKHNFSMADLHELLLSATTLGMDSGEFYIFPVYNKADKTDPQIVVARKENVAGMAPWIKINATPDGQEKEIASESRPLYTSPNIVVMVMAGVGCKPGVVGATESGSLKWTPGTGYDQCLGTLRIKRDTKIIYSGLCTVF